MSGPYTFPKNFTLTFDSANDTWNTIVKIDDTHVMVAHTGTSSDGFVRTFSVADDQFGTLTLINSFEFSIVDIIHSSLSVIDSTHFLLTYSDSVSGDGFAKTLSIDGSFIISLVDTFEFDATDGAWTSNVVLNSTKGAVAYAGPDGDGFLKTLSWDVTTADNITLVATLEHDTVGPISYNNLALVSDDDTLMVLAYTGTDGDGFIKCVTVDTSTAANPTEVAGVLEHDIVGALWNSVIKIDATHAILAYTSPTNEGFMKTFSFTAAGASLAQIASLNYETVNANHASMVLIDSTHVLVCHSSGNNANAKTLSFDSAYDNITVIDDWRYDSDKGNHDALIKMSDTRYIVAFSGDLNVGKLLSFYIEPAAAPAPTGGAGFISAGWNW